MCWKKYRHQRRNKQILDQSKHENQIGCILFIRNKLNTWSYGICCCCYAISKCGLPFSPLQRAHQSTRPTWTIVTIMQRTHTTERRNQILPLRFGTNQNIEQNVMLSNLVNLSRMGKYRHLCQELNTAKSVGRVILQTNIFIISSLTHIHSSRLSHFIVQEQSSSFQLYQPPLKQQNSICF